MKKAISLDEKLVVKMMNMFDVKVIAFTSEKEASKPEIRAKLIEQAVDGALSSKNESHLANREAYIQAVTSRLFREGKVREMGEEGYLKIIKGAKAAELSAPHEGESYIKNK